MSTPLAPQVEGTFMSAFIRATKPAGSGVLCTRLLRPEFNGGATWL